MLLPLYSMLLNNVFSCQLFNCSCSVPTGTPGFATTKKVPYPITGKAIMTSEVSKLLNYYTRFPSAKKDRITTRDFGMAAPFGRNLHSGRPEFPDTIKNMSIWT